MKGVPRRILVGEVCLNFSPLAHLSACRFTDARHREDVERDLSTNLCDKPVRLGGGGHWVASERDRYVRAQGWFGFQGKREVPIRWWLTCPKLIPCDFDAHFGRLVGDDGVYEILPAWGGLCIVRQKRAADA